MSVANGAFTRTNSFANEQDRVFPRFFMDSIEDKVASLHAGRPIFREEERVEIIMPGNPFTRPIKRVTDEERQRWPEAYAAFKKGLDQATEGTPLEEWPRLKRSQVNELKHLGFQTVEQVAAASDAVIQRIGMGGRDLVLLARAFLDTAAETAIVEQALAEREQKEMEIASLRNQLAEMSALVASLHASQQRLLDAPNPIVTAIPGMADPQAPHLLHQPGAPVAESSLASLASTPRRGGRKPLPRDENGEIIRQTA